MISINRILAPIDFDAHGEVALDFKEPNTTALKYACEFANRFNAELHILHVVQNVTEIEICTQEFEERAQKRLERLPIESINPEIPVIRKILKGRPYIEIIQYAQEHNIDLIIMGTHGRKPLSHLLIGSEAENTVRDASCPVLVVRHPEHEFVLP